MYIFPKQARVYCTEWCSQKLVENKDEDCYFCLMTKAVSRITKFIIINDLFFPEITIEYPQISTVSRNGPAIRLNREKTCYFTCKTKSTQKPPLLFLQRTGKYTDSVVKRYIRIHEQYHACSLLFYLLGLFLVGPGLEFLFYFALVLSSMTLLNQLIFQQVLFWRKFLQKGVYHGLRLAV